MAPWLVATLHERHRGIAVTEDLVDERHTHGTSTNDHAVGDEAGQPREDITTTAPSIDSGRVGW